MHTGQIILTIAALALLSVSVLNLNNMIANSDIELSQNRYRLEALSIMQSHLERATTYYFDEVSTDTSSKTLADFTAPDSLGFEANDLGVIDDFDDYNAFTTVDTGRSGIPYTLDFIVDYVTINGNDLQVSNVRQYHKRIIIRIADDYPDPMIFRWKGDQKIKDTLTVEFVQSYWFYN